jgi:hypothetical protein
MKNKQLQLSIAIAAVVILAALFRLFKSADMPNFAPIAALALFSGAALKDRKWSFVLPLGSVFLSDVFFELMQKGSGFYPGIVYNYIAYLLIILIGFALRRKVTIPGVLGASLAASVTFFIVSNLGVWISGSLGYTYSWDGLMLCFTEALAFYRQTDYASVVSDLVFSVVFFGAWYLVSRRQTATA